MTLGAVVGTAVGGVVGVDVITGVGGIIEINVNVVGEKRSQDTALTGTHA